MLLAPGHDGLLPQCLIMHQALELIIQLSTHFAQDTRAICNHCKGLIFRTSGDNAFTSRLLQSFIMHQAFILPMRPTPEPSNRGRSLLEGVVAAKAVILTVQLGPLLAQTKHDSGNHTIGTSCLVLMTLETEGFHFQSLTPCYHLH